MMWEDRVVRSLPGTQPQVMCSLPSSYCPICPTSPILGLCILLVEILTLEVLTGIFPSEEIYLSYEILNHTLSHFDFLLKSV